MQHADIVNFITNMKCQSCMPLFNKYSGTCLSKTSLWQAFVYGYTDVQSIQVRLTKISYTGTLFKAWSIQDFVLLRV